MANPKWFIGAPLDASIVAEIRAGEPVREVTVSKVYIPYKLDSTGHRFAFFNTDPVNWNLFMFPYESRKLRKEVSASYVADNVNNISAFIDENDSDFVEFADAKVPIEAEIKFSQSSNLNTLYIFVYRVIDLDEARFDFERREVAFSSANEARQHFDERAQEYASNVADIVERVIGNAGG